MYARDSNFSRSFPSAAPIPPVPIGAAVNDARGRGDDHRTVDLDGGSLSVETVRRISRDTACSVRLSDTAEQRMEASREAMALMVDSGRPIYGVTTGYGDNADRHIPPERASLLQSQMVLYHLAGVGNPVDPEVVRATLLIRANTLAAGWSGIRPLVARMLLKLLEHNALPVIPARGSVGASGDLVPLSYIAAALSGEGELNYKGSTRSSAAVLDELNLSPLKLEPKEGLALINGTAFSAALATLAVGEAEDIAFLAEIGTALSAEALLADRGAFDPFIHEVKPHPGQVCSAGRLRELLRGSSLTTDHATRLDEASAETKEAHYASLPRAIQDRYSIRCAPQVIGVLRDTIEWAKNWLRIEINSASDNPLFTRTPPAVHSGGNFYAGHVAMAADALKIAVSSIADLLDRQVALLVDARYSNGLPANLIESDSNAKTLSHGLKGLQLTMSAVTAESLSRSTPSSTFSRSTECHNQDKVSMSAMAARSARDVTQLVTEAAAIHLLVACQAVDFRGRNNCGAGTGRAHDLIRSVCAHVAQDRRLDSDISAILSIIDTLRDLS
ncbi:MAG: HAL/PAL/TAL family ammonia-lyase [Segniliparus sp.]|uniref:HAL/PAL/TAL family ammonia-lyase n=1 Tax=Segniliparus sp. TaxID=2804064 RepID=UPI003F32B6B6